MKILHKSLPGLVAVLLFMALGMAFTFWAFSQIEAASSQRKSSGDLIVATDAIMSSIKDAETSQRGYALTGDEAYLQPYLEVRDGLAAQLAALRQLTTSLPAQQHLDAIAPLLAAKIKVIDETVALRRNRDMQAALALINSGEGKRLMDAIRVHMHSVAQIEATLHARHNAEFDASMRRLFAIIVAIGILGVLVTLYFAYVSRRATQQRLKDLVHAETEHLLQVQTITNERLRDTNRALSDSELKLAVTLHSIGDAVISTDTQARVTLLNPVAEEMTGWTHAEALGRPIDEVFHIIHKTSREPATIPVAETLAKGSIQRLSNHTVLLARDGREFDIAHSCAPIRDEAGQLAGAVLVFHNVTGEYAVRQSLADSAARVQAILNTVSDGIVTLHAQGGVVESVNPAVEAMFGYSAAELQGKAFGFLIPELDQEQHNVALEHYGASDAARAVGQGREVMGFRKDGSFFPLEIAVNDMVLGGQRYFTGILRDISARKHAEEALRKDSALQDAIFNSANFSCIATDAKGVIQIFNVGAERMLGYAAAEVVNQITPADISDPQEVIARASYLSRELQTDISPGFPALVFKASRGIEDIYELTYIRKDGTRFAALLSVTALRDDDNTIIGYLLIGTDNTARKRVEAERTQLDQVLQMKNIELEAARAAADKANQAKSEFLSSMSHELRSPLNAILGFAQLIDSGAPHPTPTQKSNLGQILKGGWYLLELINEILDLALIESGKLSMSMEPISLPDVLLDCQAMIEPQASKKGIRMHFPAFTSPCFVQADRTRVMQVVVNLLSNAIKYNHVSGSVDVTCRVGSHERLYIGVRDTGDGLSATQLSQLFQPFNRLGQEESAEEGTGIGLVVSKRLVELMGGSIGAESTVGQGSEFWIELNMATPHQLDLANTPPTLLLEQAPTPTGQMRTMLYVEDNQANMELVAQLVARRADIRLLRASDGLRGIALARAHVPDLILMDINLPGISGLQALKILREDPLTSGIPVMALSANAMPRDIEKGIEAGFFCYLTKPIKIAPFMEALDAGLALGQVTAEHEKTEIALQPP